jgi:hypothetical protein
VRPKSFEPKINEQPLAVEEITAAANEALRTVHMKERVVRQARRAFSRRSQDRDFRRPRIKGRRAIFYSQGFWPK